MAVAENNALRVGEGLVLGFKGSEVPGWLRRFESRFGLGGVILFDYDLAAKRHGNNIVSPQQLHGLCAELSALPSRPLILIDQEGGQVRRLKEEAGFAPLPSAEAWAGLGAGEKRRLLERSYAEMKELGIDLNLAPVIDLNLDPRSPDIGLLGRSLAASPVAVAENVMMIAEVARTCGLGLCLKHYPGLGGAKSNSHLEITDLTGTVDDAQLELFHALAPEIPGEAILVSHGLVEHWEPGLPVSMSPVALGDLRRRLPGVLLISDDVQMAGLRKVMDTAQAVRQGLHAGCDLVIAGNNLVDEQGGMEEAAGRLEEAVSGDPELGRNHQAARERVALRKRDLKGAQPAASC